MDVFSSMILPLSSEQIIVLQYLQAILLLLFLPFSGLIIAGTTISLLYRRKALTTNDKKYLELSEKIISICTINKSMGAAAGLLPALALFMTNMQLIYINGSQIGVFLFVALTAYCAGLILIYVYRYSFSFNRYYNSGIYGLVLISFAVIIYLSSMSFSVFPEKWLQTKSILSLVFSADVLTRVLFFCSASLAITSVFLIFMIFYWNEGKNTFTDEQKRIVKKNSTGFIFLCSVLAPLFMFAGILVLPERALSASVYGYLLIAVILVLFVYIFTYAMLKDRKEKYSGYIFVMLLFVFFANTIKDQAASRNATALHSIQVNMEYAKYIQTLSAGSGEEISEAKGEEVYKRICITCHRFDQKLVGPPYKETLPKYEGKIDELAAFISNPVKKNPGYPAMPNQNLKPGEAKSVAKYILEQYKK